MKLKWPKFLTVKRTIWFALLLLVIVFALVYFLGGYKASALQTDTMDFDETGFISYEKILNDEIEDNANKFTELVNELTVANFDEKIANVLDKCKTVEYYTELDAKLEKLANQDSANKAKYVNPISVDSLITAEINAKNTLDVYTLLLEKLDNTNTGYRLYLNYRTTQFKIERVEAGVAKNEWYSNPQNLADAKSSGATLSNQKSPIILYYYTPNGAPLPMNAFDYAINDNIGSDETPNYVNPTFSYKPNPENGTLQVYYTFEEKGDKYYDYPKALSEATLNKLIADNRLYVLNKAKEIRQYNAEQLQDYFNEHYAVRYISNTTGTTTSTVKTYSYIGPAAYKYFTESSTMLELVDLPELFKDLSLSEKREYVEIMFRLEYEFIENARHDYVKEQLIKSDMTSLTQYYKKHDPTDEHNYIYYDLESSYESLGDTPIMIQFVKQTLTKKLQYDKEDLERDQAEFDVVIEVNKPSFKACIQYQITEYGFDATIINESIYESMPEKNPAFKIEILPYFSAISNTYKLFALEDELKTFKSTASDCDYQLEAIELPKEILCPKCNIKHKAEEFIELPIEELESNGYMVIPDGSGGIVNLNNGKLAYSKRVYSTDLAFIDEVKQTASQDVLLPMFALTYDSVDFVQRNDKDLTGSSIIARITKGAPQMILNANVSSSSDIYNRVYFAATYREAQEITMGPAYDVTRVTKVTETNVQTDYTVEYSLINERGLTYSDIAKRYQEKLFGDILDKDVIDQTNSTVLNAEYLGLYDYKTNFLGIVYDGYDTLTTYSQAVEITKQLKIWGAKEINVMYLGWQDSGLINETFNDMKFTKDLGSKKELQAMLDYFSSNSVTLYPVVSFYEINKFNESFGKIRYASRDISNEFTEKYPYDLASGVFDKKQRAIYTLSPKFFDVFSDNLIENFTKHNETLNAMAFEQLGSKIVGDYEKRQEFFRYNSVVEQLSVLNKLEQNKIDDINLTAPYQYAVKYADNIVELPYESTLLDIFDYSIPFYQLVMSGYRDYSGTIINANDEKGLNNHIMKILETGSNIEFTFSYDSSDELIQTDYNYYYYTQYIDWQKEVKSLLTVLDTLDVHKYYLASHEAYNNNHSVFKVTYKVKPGLETQVSDPEFSIYLNYSDMNIDLGLTNLTCIDIENSDEQYNPFKNKTTNGILNPWSCATDKEVA